MTSEEKHIEKLLSWYKEAVTEDGVCYLTSDDKNTLAYAIKCCKHFEDIKKDIDSWALREEPSSSKKPNMSVEEKCPCYDCEYFEKEGLSHCKIYEGAYGDCRCNNYHKVNQDSNKSEKPTGSDDCISRFSAKQLVRKHYCSIPSKVYSKLIVELDNLPSVTPQEPRWIPVSERLPTKEEYIANNGLFIVTDGNRTYAEYFDVYNSMKYFGEPTMNGFRVDRCVTAWMPLPNAYREVEE